MLLSPCSGFIDIGCVLLHIVIYTILACCICCCAVGIIIVSCKEYKSANQNYARRRDAILDSYAA